MNNKFLQSCFSIFRQYLRDSFSLQLCCIMISAVLYYGICCAVLWYPLCCIMVSAVLYYGIRCAVLWNPLCCIMEFAVLHYGIHCAVFWNSIQLDKNWYNENGPFLTNLEIYFMRLGHKDLLLNA